MANAVANGVLTESSGTWTLGTKTLSSSISFEDCQKEPLVESKIGNQTDGMLMSNAPLSEMNDTKAAEAPALKPVHILVEVAGSNIASTQTTAAANPVRVYIERAAAKVQVTIASDVKNPLDKTKTIASTSVKWITDNKEATFYTVRVPGEASGKSSVGSYREYTSENLASGTYSYRFFSALTESNRSDDYRMYWAIDPHYDYTSITSSKELVGSLAGASAVTKDAGDTDYEYITENTFNEYGLRKDHTTRVVLSVEYNDGNNFYTVVGSDDIYKEGNCTTDGTLAKKLLEYVVNLSAVKSWATTNSKDLTKVTLEVDEPITAAGSVGNDKITLKYDGATATDLTTAAGDIATAMKITCYLNGLSYYQARIKHFGDTHTPLSTSLAGSTYTDIYGDPAATNSKTAKNFLGRYSVVRNNWYILKVTAIKQLGTATIPEPDTTPDDDNNQYITTEIYVNKWAQRTQNVELY